MQFNKWIIAGIIIVLSILLGFLGGIYLKKPQVITNPVPVYIQGKDSIITKHYYHSVKDTSKAEVKDEVAYGNFYNEKTFDDDTVKIITNVEYHLPDSNFNFFQYIDLVKSSKLRVDTLLIKVPTDKVIYKDVPIWESPYINFVLGLIAAITIFLLGG